MRLTDEERAALRDAVKAAAKDATAAYKPNRADRRRTAQGKGRKASSQRKADARRDTLVEAMRRKNEER